MRLRAALAAAALTAGLSLPLSVAGAASASDCASGPDFNGDGRSDLVVGDPGASVDGIADAGAVRVIYGGGVTPQSLTQGMGLVGDGAEAGDGFGAVVTTGDVDDDQCVDVVVGVPAEDVGTAKDAGTTHVIYGSPSGLGTGKAPAVWVQGKDKFAGTAEAGDRFGAALSYSKGRAGYPALLIGVPGEDISGKADAGMVYSRHFYTDPSIGGEVLGTFGITQDTAGVDGAVEAGDEFGASVTGNSVVGAPGEAIGADKGAGMVHVFNGMGPTFADYSLSQDLSTISGAAEAGDRFGESVSLLLPAWGPDFAGRLAIGVPGEDLGSAADAGMAHTVTTGTTSAVEVQALHQDVDGIDDTAESGDRFGQTVNAFNASGLNQGSDVLTLAVSATGEDSGGGAVHVFSLRGDPGAADLLLWQGQSDIPAGRRQSGEHFGAVIAESGDTLWIGAPDDAEHPEGIVHGVPMTRFRGGTGAPSTLVSGQDGIPASGDRFGAGIA
ncbi:hypothetical protein [Actinomadura sp. HBU206391]|uniref:hypothetical protein n=1 Tax=Actinomadura sp. HBU206391 TaxID=2731692 RepID=UPI00164F6E32|nr:hypothetical protein [Actinomadura sp. HBU206391]MBC6458192.1 hypothetical protein [Actinomadura sp. HBU206391]